MPKITALDAAAAITADDLLVLVDDPGGSPSTKKEAVSTLVTLLNSSYVNVTGDDITVADGGNRTGLTITQNDVTNNPVTVSLVSAAAENVLNIDANGNVGTNVATDGALLVENTGNTGIGLNVYTNIGATADATLVSIKADNSAYDQSVVTLVNDGVGTAWSQTQNGTLAANQKIASFTWASDNSNSGSGGVFITTSFDQTSNNATRGLMNIHNDRTGSAAIPLQLRMSGGNDAFQIDMNSNNRALFVDHDDTGTTSSLYVDRDGNNAAKIWGVQVDVDNAGAGGVGGIDLSSFSTGEAVLKFVADATDPTAGGGAAIGQIAIDIGGTIRHLAYYT